MTDDEAADKMRKIRTFDDPESSHQKADKILIELLFNLGYFKTVHEWKMTERWYG